MRAPFLSAVLVLLLSACGSALETVTPGRGVEKEVGLMAKVYPSGKDARVDRHGLWRGMNADQVVWEVRYTRGLPTGPYREWNAEGELIATWPYNWEGEIEGWARWFTEGAPDGKILLSLENQPDIEVIGRAQAFKNWMVAQQTED
ncbi:hypothetical protein P0Y35_01210 [Kiritimatiellaeota bacterium B1221]|nr:hypothetical protein [Kiritimatiellaeota bacterium B1221]